MTTYPAYVDPLLILEETALKARLQGLVVKDQANNARPVKVRFSFPDKEEGEQIFPYALITLVDVSVATEREHAGEYDLSVIPEWFNPTPSVGDQVRGYWPTPINLDYQVSIYSRNPRHNRSLISQTLDGILPMRAGILQCGDGSTRRLDLLDYAHREVTDSASIRTYISNYTLRISSELTPTSLAYLGTKVTSVNVASLNDVYNQSIKAI